MKSAILVGMATLVLTGCSLITPKISGKVADGVHRYCQEPESVRLVIREEVNSMIKPNSIRVYCYGDETNVP